MRSFYDLMGVPSTEFDSDHRFVTSWLLSPAILASTRLLFALYCFATIFTGWGWDAVHHDAEAIGKEFSYFTDLTYWGVCLYLLVAGVHGFVYVRHGQSWLDRWPRPLQLLHSLYYTTIVTLPFLVSIVFWCVLYSGTWWTDSFSAWMNVSKHGLNSFSALSELLLATTNPPPLLHLPFLILILALYLAIAYLTHYTQGWYTYSFLNPHGGRSSGRVAAYVFGVLGAAIALFFLVWALIWVRRKLTRGLVKRSKHDTGTQPPYLYGERHDTEINMK